ncbi:DNA polymerase III subunit theta [Sodalis sp. (in: enterobacteria)]|uniref:DNA polymerase III subunit theta n=1 Tax=Sodalis sp. (in: enterobacteria) TaxID=1898979 RepID=UPI0039E53364
MAVDLVAAGVAYKERTRLPVAAEAVAREQSKHLRVYFTTRLAHHRQLRQQLPGANDARYAEMAEVSKKGP